MSDSLSVVVTSATHKSIKDTKNMSHSLRYNWTKQEVLNLYKLPFLDLVYQAQQIHREFFLPNEVQVSTLLSIKTGGCPENCKYCSQSARNKTNIEKESLINLELVLTKAKQAKAAGASRFCMGAALRGPTNRQLDKIIPMIKEVKALGMETCVTLGLLNQEQAITLKAAGLDFYNHNINTSEEFHEEIVTTHTFTDRLTTIAHVQNAGIKVCCGGIVGLGETKEDRVSMLVKLANFSPHPQSVPINALIAIKGTPFEDNQKIDNFDFIRVIALARILMPQSFVRLSAGRDDMSEETQALCFMSGANSIFYGETLLTAKNPTPDKDRTLLEKLSIKTI